jgi:hypothetical protein
MTEFHSSSEKASRKIAALTWARIALTVVIAIFTVALFFRG